MIIQLIKNTIVFGITNLLNQVEKIHNSRIGKIKLANRITDRWISKLMMYRWNLKGTSVCTENLELLNIQSNRLFYNRTSKYIRFFYYESFNHYMFEPTSSALFVQKLGTRYIIQLHQYTSHNLKIDHFPNDIKIFESNYYSNDKLKNRMFTKYFINAIRSKPFLTKQYKNSYSYLNLKLNLLANKLIDNMSFYPKYLDKITYTYRPITRLKKSIFFKKIFQNRIHLSTMVNLDRNLINWEFPFINMVRIVKKRINPYPLLGNARALVAEWFSLLRIFLDNILSITRARLSSKIKKINNKLHPIRSNAKRRSKLIKNLFTIIDILLEFGFHAQALKDYSINLYIEALEECIYIYGMFFNIQGDTMIDVHRLLEFTIPVLTYRLFMCITLNRLTKYYFQLYKQPLSISNKTNNLIAFMKTNANIYGYFFENKFYYLFLKKLSQKENDALGKRSFFFSFISRNIILLNYSTNINKALHNENTFYFPISTHLQNLIGNIVPEYSDSTFRAAYDTDEDIYRGGNGKYSTITGKMLRNQFEYKPVDMIVLQRDIDMRTLYKRLAHGEISGRMAHLLKKTRRHNKLSRILYTNTIIYENAAIAANESASTSNAINYNIIGGTPNKKNIHNIYRKLLSHMRRNGMSKLHTYTQNGNISQLYSMFAYKIATINPTLVKNIYKQITIMVLKQLIVPMLISLVIKNNYKMKFETFAKQALLESIDICMQIFKGKLPENIIISKLFSVLKLTTRLNEVLTYYWKDCHRNNTWQLNSDTVINKLILIQTLLNDRYKYINKLTHINALVPFYYSHNIIGRISQVHTKINKIKCHKKDGAESQLLYFKYNTNTNEIKIYQPIKSTTLLSIATSIYYLKSKEINNSYNEVSRYNILSFRKFLQRTFYKKNNFINRWRTFKDLFYDLISNYKTTHKEPSFMEEELDSDNTLGFDWQTLAQYYIEAEDYPYPRSTRRTSDNGGLGTYILDAIYDGIYHERGNHLYVTGDNFDQKPEFAWLFDLYDLYEDDEPDTELLAGDVAEEDIKPVDLYMPPMIHQYEQEIASHKLVLWEIGQTNNNNTYIPSFFDKKLYYLDYIDYLFYKYGIIEMPLEKRILSESTMDEDYDERWTEESGILLQKKEMHDTKGCQTNNIDDSDDTDKHTDNEDNEAIQNDANNTDDVNDVLETSMYDKRDDVENSEDMTVSDEDTDDTADRYTTEREEEEDTYNFYEYYENRYEDKAFKHALWNRIGIINKFTWDINSFDLQFKIDKYHKSSWDILSSYYNEYLERLGVLNMGDYSNQMSYAAYITNNSKMNDDIDIVPYQIAALRWMVANNTEKLRNIHENKTMFKQIQKKLSSMPINFTIGRNLEGTFDYTAETEAAIFNIGYIKTLVKPGIPNLNIMPGYVRNILNNDIYLYRKFVSSSMELLNIPYTQLISLEEKARSAKNIILYNNLTSTYELLSHMMHEQNYTDSLHRILLYKNNIVYYNEIILPIHLYMKDYSSTFFTQSFNNNYDFNIETTSLEIQDDIQSNKYLYVNDLCTFTEWDRKVNQFGESEIPPDALLSILGYTMDLEYERSSDYVITELISEFNKQIMEYFYTGPTLNADSIINSNERNHRSNAILSIYPKIISLKEQLTSILKNRLKRNKRINTNLLISLKKDHGKSDTYTKYSYKILRDAIDKHNLFSVPMALVLLFVADLPFVTKYYKYIMNNLIKNIDLFHIPHMDIRQLNKYDRNLYKQTMYKIYLKSVYLDNKVALPSNYLFKNEYKTQRNITRFKSKDLSAYAKLHNLNIERRFIWYIYKAWSNKLNIRDEKTMNSIYKLYKLLFIKNNLTNTKLSLLQLDEIIPLPYLRMDRYKTNLMTIPAVAHYLHEPMNLDSYKIYMYASPVVIGLTNEGDESDDEENEEEEKKKKKEEKKNSSEVVYYESSRFAFTMEDSSSVYYLDRSTLYRYNVDGYYLTYIAFSNKSKVHYFLRYKPQNMNLKLKDHILEKTYGHFLATAAKKKKEDINKGNSKNQDYYFPVMSNPTFTKTPNALIDLAVSFQLHNAGSLYYPLGTAAPNIYSQIVKKLLHTREEHVPYNAHFGALCFHPMAFEFMDFDIELNDADRFPEELELVEETIEEEWDLAFFSEGNMGMGDTDETIIMHPWEEFIDIYTNAELIQFLNTLYSTRDPSTDNARAYIKSRGFATKYLYFINDVHILFYLNILILSPLLYNDSDSLLLYNINRQPSFTDGEVDLLTFLVKYPLALISTDEALDRNEDSTDNIFQYFLVDDDTAGNASIKLKKLYLHHKERRYDLPYFENFKHDETGRMPFSGGIREPLRGIDFNIKSNPILRLFTRLGYKIWDEQLNFMLLLQQNKYWNINYASDITLFLHLFSSVTTLLTTPFKNIAEIKNSLKKFNFQDESTPAYLQKYHTTGNIKEFNEWLGAYAYGLHEYNRFVPENYALLFTQQTLNIYLHGNFINSKEYSLLARRSLNKWLTKLASAQSKLRLMPEEFFTYPDRRIMGVDTIEAKRVLKAYNFSINPNPYYFPRTGYESYPYSYALNMLYFHYNLATHARITTTLYDTFPSISETTDTFFNRARQSYLSLQERFRKLYIYPQLIRFWHVWFNPDRPNIERAFGSTTDITRYAETFFYDGTNKHTKLWDRNTDSHGMILPKIRAILLDKYSPNYIFMQKYGLHHQLSRFFTPQTIKASDINLLYKPYLVSSTYNNTPIFTLHPSLKDKYDLNFNYDVNTGFFVFPKQEIAKMFTIDTIYGPDTVVATSKPFINMVMPYNWIDHQYFDLSRIMGSYIAYSKYTYTSNAMNHAHLYGPLWSIYQKSGMDGDYASNLELTGKSQSMASSGLSNFMNTVPDAMDASEHMLEIAARLDEQEMPMPITLPASPINYPAIPRFRIWSSSDEVMIDALVSLYSPSSIYFAYVSPPTLDEDMDSETDYGKLLMKTLHSMYVPYNFHSLRKFTSYIPLGYDLNTKDLLNNNYIKTQYWYHPSFYSTFAINSHSKNEIRAYQSTRVLNSRMSYNLTQFGNTPLQHKNWENYDDYLSHYREKDTIEDDLDYDEDFENYGGIPTMEYLMDEKERGDYQKNFILLEAEKLNNVQNPTQKQIKKKKHLNELAALINKEARAKKAAEDPTENYILSPLINFFEEPDYEEDHPFYDNDLDNFYAQSAYKMTDTLASFDGKKNMKHMYSMELDQFAAPNIQYMVEDLLLDDGLGNIANTHDLKKLFGSKKNASYGQDKRPDIMHPFTRTYLPNRIYGEPKHYLNNAPIYANRYKFINIYEHFRIKPFLYMHPALNERNVHSPYLKFVFKKVFNNNINRTIRLFNKIVYPFESQWSSRRSTHDMALLDIQYQLSHRLNPHVQKYFIEHPNEMSAKYEDMWIQKYGRYFPSWPPAFTDQLTFGVDSEKKHAYLKFRLALMNPYNMVIQSMYYRPSKSFYPTAVMWQYSNSLGFGKTKNWIHNKIPKELEFILHENFYGNDYFPEDIILDILREQQSDIQKYEIPGYIVRDFTRDPRTSDPTLEEIMDFSDIYLDIYSTEAVQPFLQPVGEAEFEEVEQKMLNLYPPKKIKIRAPYDLNNPDTFENISSNGLKDFLMSVKRHNDYVTFLEKDVRDLFVNEDQEMIEMLVEWPSYNNNVNIEQFNKALTDQSAVSRYYPSMDDKKIVTRNVFFPKPEHKSEQNLYERTYINRTYFDGFLNQQSRKIAKNTNEADELAITIHKNQDVYKAYNMTRHVIRQLQASLTPGMFIREHMANRIAGQNNNNIITGPILMNLLDRQREAYLYLTYRIAINRDIINLKQESLAEDYGYTIAPWAKGKPQITFVGTDDIYNGHDIADNITYFRDVSKVDYYSSGGRDSHNTALAARMLVPALKPKKYSKETYSMLELAKTLLRSKQIRSINTKYNIAFDRTRKFHTGGTALLRRHLKLNRLSTFSPNIYLDDVLAPDAEDYTESVGVMERVLLKGGILDLQFRDSYWIYMSPKMLKHRSNKYYTQELVTYRMDPTKPIDYTDPSSAGSVSVRGTFTEKQFVYNYRMNHTKYTMPFVDYFYYTQYSVDKTYILNLYKYYVLTRDTPTVFEEHSDNMHAFIPNYKQKSFVFKYNGNTNDAHIRLENMELLNIISLVMNDISVSGAKVTLDSYLYHNSFARPMFHWFLKIYYNNIHYFDAFYSWTCDSLSSIIIF